jgi:hypothetical protein
MKDNRHVHSPDELPDHESGVRRMAADAAGRPYQALRSLVEAQAAVDGVVVLEGDYGGQIYVVVPAREVRCSEEALTQLLADIDEGEWADEGGARVYYERHALGASISGGMGGGTVAAPIWVHPKLNVAPISILEVLHGERSRLIRGAG